MNDVSLSKLIANVSKWPQSPFDEKVEKKQRHRNKTLQKQKRKPQLSFG